MPFSRYASFAFNINRILLIHARYSELCVISFGNYLRRADENPWKADMNDIEVDTNNRWAALLDAAVDAIIVIDAKGNIELLNHAAESMFGYTQSDVIGKNIKMLMPEPHQSKHDDYLQQYQLTGKASIIGQGRKTTGLRANKHTFPIHLSIGKVEHASHVQFIGIVRDITEQENYRIDAQNIREKLAHVARLNTMGELVAGVAHEMNQPLSAISNYANASINLLAKKTATSSDSESPCVNAQIANIQVKIEDQVSRAIALNSRLKTFVKKRGGQREQVALNQLILDTVELAKIDTRLRDHNISVDLASNPEPYIFADHVQIQQVMLNLIRNGLDAMTQQGDQLAIASEWQDGSHIKISIIDHGAGVNDLIRHELFEPFVTSKKDGMGMGLPVSQTIIHAYGGEISFHENRNQGTTFSFTLPTVAIQNDQEGT